jgi:hypothetical protein
MAEHVTTMVKSSIGQQECVGENRLKCNGQQIGQQIRQQLRQHRSTK